MPTTPATATLLLSEALQDSHAVSGHLQILLPSVHTKDHPLPFVKRFFVLTGHSLLMFAHASPVEAALDSIEIRRTSQLDARGSPDHPFLFEVKAADGASWRLNATNKTVKNAWIHELENAIADSDSVSSGSTANGDDYWDEYWGCKTPTTEVVRDGRSSSDSTVHRRSASGSTKLGDYIRRNPRNSSQSAVSEKVQSLYKELAQLKEDIQFNQEVLLLQNERIQSHDGVLRRPTIQQQAQWLGIPVTHHGHNVRRLSHEISQRRSPPPLSPSSPMPRSSMESPRSGLPAREFPGMMRVDESGKVIPRVVPRESEVGVTRKGSGVFSFSGKWRKKIAG